MNFNNVLSYDPHTGEFRRVANGRVTGTLNGKGYLQVYAFGKRWSAHRVAWFMSNGSWPLGVIDHINRDPADNRLQNLRDVSPSLNNENRAPFEYPPKPAGVTGVKGVSLSGRGDYIVRRWDKKRRKQVYLGRTASLMEAEIMAAS